MSNEAEILKKAAAWEKDTRNRHRAWEYYSIGATKADIRQLLDDGKICVSVKMEGLTRYELTEKGRNIVWAITMEREFARVPASSVLEAMDLVIGWDDIKTAIAQAIQSQRRVHFLLEGPPACAKSVMLEGVRSAVPDSYIAFGSRTSASGLSEALFENQPRMLLLDEADKMHHDCYSVLLGLMESGEVLETKSRKSRGIKLETSVYAACNSSVKMPAEFLSRFALHIRFPAYTREQFIEVCRKYLGRAENCPEAIADLIGRMVFDNAIGDIRKGRAVWQLMLEPTEAEVRRVIELMVRYGPDQQPPRERRVPRRVANNRIPGL